MNNIIYTSREEKKEIVKAGISNDKFDNHRDEIIKCTGIVLYEKSSTNDDVIVVSAIRKEDGSYLTSISPTVYDSLMMITNVYEKEEVNDGIEIVIRSGKSNSGRDYLYVDLV